MKIHSERLESDSKMLQCWDETLTMLWTARRHRP